jgi:hypothetical protein
LCVIENGTRPDLKLEWAPILLTNETQRVHGPSVGGKEKAYLTMVVFFCEVMTWMEDVSWSGSIRGNNSFSIEFLKSCLQKKNCVNFKSKYH